MFAAEVANEFVKVKEDFNEDSAVTALGLDEEQSEHLLIAYLILMRF